MTTTRPEVAVVGAGLAGLAAAVSLRRAGMHVEIFERTRLVGGKATSFAVDGIEVDNGQHVVLACCTAFLDFVRELGMSASLRMQRRFAVTVLASGGRTGHLRADRLPAPLHLAPSFAAYPHLSPRDKVGVARALMAARRDVPADLDMAAWLDRHRQSAAARRAFWDLFLLPAVNAPLDQVSAFDALFVIRTAFLSHRDAARIGWTTVPLKRLADRAASHAAAVHLRTPVVDVVHDSSHATGVRTDDGRLRRFDAVVLAIPPRRLASVLQGAEDLGVTGLDRFTTQPIVDVHLWYDLPAGRRALGDAGFAALLDSPVQWVFEKSRGYLCCSMSAARELITVPERELVDLCHRELTRTVPALREAGLRRGAATRDPEATFVPTPGLHRPGATTTIDNVAVAGAWTDTGWPATMESAVRSGREAAAHLLATLARARREQVREVMHAV